MRWNLARFLCKRVRRFLCKWIWNVHELSRVTLRNEEERRDVERHESSEQFVTFRAKSNKYSSYEARVFLRQIQSRVRNGGGQNSWKQSVENRDSTIRKHEFLRDYSRSFVSTAGKTQFRRIQFARDWAQIARIVARSDSTEILDRESSVKRPLTSARMKESLAENKTKTRDHYMLGQILQESWLAISSASLDSQIRRHWLTPTLAFALRDSERFSNEDGGKGGGGGWSTSLRNFLRRCIE